MTHRIWEIENGTKPKPTETGELQNTWLADNARAMFLLAYTLEPEQLRPLLTCETACEMWKKLSTVHEQRSASNKLLLSTRLYDYRMASSDSIIQHIAKVQNMAAQLIDVGEPVTETTIKAKILGSLSAKYSNFQTAWDNVPQEIQTLGNLEERLLREEARLTASDEGPSAFAATKKNQVKKNGDKPTSREAKVRNSDSKREVRCCRCQGLGHYARNCKNKNKKKESERDASESRDCAFIVECAKDKKTIGKSEKVDIPIDVANSVLSANKRDCWLTDSGASRHITYRRDWLSNYRDLPDGGTVSLGDNKECRVAGEGTVEIEKFVYAANGRRLGSKMYYSFLT